MFLNILTYPSGLNPCPMKPKAEDVIAELPEDASENIDHYLYGVPKKPKRLEKR